ncbi:MAG: hypothetical protein F4Y92_08240 [Dehalococcoidia bacterium]|nr:hypothetical protein [Dehalococcoidia bacterium]
MKRLRPSGLDTSPVDLRPWQPPLVLLSTTAAAVFTLALTVGLSLSLSRGPLAEYEYSIGRWQADHLAGSIFSLLGVGEELDEQEEAERLREYFRLTSAIRAELQAESPDRALLEALTNERALYENDVERIIERYVTDAVVMAGLKRPLPLFDDVKMLWPAMDIELTNPPQVLVRSPRHEIRSEGYTLLQPDLTLAAIERVEAQTDDEDTVSVVLPIGGLAVYPAIIREDRSYYSILRTAAHEWVHFYLAFYPLGLAYNAPDGPTLNETVANVAEREIARIARELHPIDLPEGGDGRAPPRERSSISFSEVMRDLRLTVDDLLAAGRVAEAEALMEERRLYLAEHGIFIRKINQAYFAFYGSYATLPQSSDPIGPKVERVWEETGELALFFALVREVESVADLDDLLVRLGVDPSTVTVEGASVE